MLARLLLLSLLTGFSLTGCQLNPFKHSTAESQQLKTLIAQHILPDRARTPGVVRAAIPLRELCRPGHATQVRRELTDSEWITRKRQVYALYGITHHNRGDFEVDHLISLELNGSNSIENLFPQTQHAEWSAVVKDNLENKLHKLVCNGQVSLKEADTAISQNWIEAYKKYVAQKPIAVSPERD